MGGIGRKIIEGLQQAVAGDLARVTIDGQVWSRGNSSEMQALLTELVTHFTIKDGLRKDKNQYGHLELWWAGKSVEEQPDALTNPWMLLASAENSYSLGRMGHLAGILDSARKLLDAARTPPRSAAG